MSVPLAKSDYHIFDSNLNMTQIELSIAVNFGFRSTDSKPI
jgi:hypothetical protein